MNFTKQLVIASFLATLTACGGSGRDADLTAGLQANDVAQKECPADVKAHCANTVGTTHCVANPTPVCISETPICVGSFEGAKDKVPTWDYEVLNPQGGPTCFGELNRDGSVILYTGGGGLPDGSSAYPSIDVKIPSIAAVVSGKAYPLSKLEMPFNIQVQELSVYDPATALTPPPSIGTAVVTFPTPLTLGSFVTTDVDGYVTRDSGQTWREVHVHVEVMVQQ